MLISKRVTELKAHRVKAPKGFMFRVWDIHFVIITAGNNSIAVINYLLEDDLITIDEESELLAVMSSDIAGQAEDFAFTTGEETKFISIGPQGSNAFVGSCIIHYDLVKASKTDLIWEWFRKGR